MAVVFRFRALARLWSAGALVLGGAGCGWFATSEERPVQPVEVRTPAQGSSMTVGALDELAKNCADRFVARVSTACDDLKRGASSESARREAHQVKLLAALAAYDVVTSPSGASRLPSAAQHILDLTTLIELQGIQWNDEGEARKTFGVQAGPLEGALREARTDAWHLSAHLLSPAQRDQLKTLILRWRQRNPDVRWLTRVRLDVIAEGEEGTTFIAAVAGAFNPLEPTLQAIDEIRLTAQEAMFYAKRLPTIGDWTVEATVADAIAVPEVRVLLNNVAGLVGTLSRATTTLERLASPSPQEPWINSTISEVRDALHQAKELVREVRKLEPLISPLWEQDEGKDAGKSMDVGAVASRVDEAAKRATALVRELQEFVESPQARRNVDAVLDRTGVEVSKAGRRIIDHAAWRGVELALGVAVLVVFVKLLTGWIRKMKQRTSPREN